jgi:undecaprenyl-diphosphatase
MKSKKIFYSLGLSALFVLILGLLNLKTIRELDFLVSNHIPLLWNPILTKTMIIITTIGGIWVIAPLVVIFLIYFDYRKKISKAYFFGGIMLTGSVLGEIIKVIVQRVRPEGIIAETGYSFPSSHSVASIMFFSLLIYFFKNKIKNKFKRGVFIGFCALIFLLIGFSRIYLNVHWLSDVIGGFVAGLYVFLMFLVFKKEKN